MKRYELFADDFYGKLELVKNEDENGYWVKYSDVKQLEGIYNDCEAHNTELEKELDYYKKLAQFANVYFINQQYLDNNTDNEGIVNIVDDRAKKTIDDMLKAWTNYDKLKQEGYE